MPRQRRQFNLCNWWHLIVKGVAGQILFEESKDYLFYLHILEKYSIETEIRINAYCLMENHVHLLVYDDHESIPLFMQKMGVSYANYFNKKYERNGHLFQNRYTSKPIESESSFLAVFRYIMQNPQKAGISPADSYPWSSYSLYDAENTFIDSSMIRSLIGSSKQYKDFIAAEGKDDYRKYMFGQTDEWARDKIKELFQIESTTALQSWGLKKRNQALRQLKDEGLSVRQIARLTGISKSIVQRA